MESLVSFWLQYIHLTCDLTIDVWRFKLWLCLLFLSGIAHCHRHWTQRTCTNSEASKTPLFCSQLKVPQTKWDTVDGRNQANQLIGSFSHYSRGFYASQVMVRRISAKSRIDSPNRPRSAAQNQGPFKIKVASPFTRASQPHWRWVDHRDSLISTESHHLYNSIFNFQVSIFQKKCWLNNCRNTCSCLSFHEVFSSQLVKHLPRCLSYCPCEHLRPHLLSLRLHHCDALPAWVGHPPKHTHIHHIEVYKT